LRISLHDDLNRAQGGGDREKRSVRSYRKKAPVAVDRGLSSKPAEGPTQLNKKKETCQARAQQTVQGKGIALLKLGVSGENKKPETRNKERGVV